MPDRHPESFPTNLPLLVLAWAIVSIPTAWGLSYTIQSAMKIFTSDPRSSAAPSPPTTAMPATGSPNRTP